MAAKFAPDGQYISPLAIRVGSSFTKDYQWKTGDPAAGVDMTGWTGECHIRAKIGDPEPLVVLSTANGKLTLGATGEIHMDLLEADTLLLKGYKKAVFDIEIAYGDFKKNIVGGDITVLPEVTRDY